MGGGPGPYLGGGGGHVAVQQALATQLRGVVHELLGIKHGGMVLPHLGGWQREIVAGVHEHEIGQLNFVGQCAQPVEVPHRNIGQTRHAKAAQRGQPATWPQPIPTPTVPGSVEQGLVVVAAQALHAVAGGLQAHQVVQHAAAVGALVHVVAQQVQLIVRGQAQRFFHEVAESVQAPVQVGGGVAHAYKGCSE